MRKNHIVHLTTVHYPFDIRIFQKECRSLIEAGYDVTLIATHKQEEVVNGVNIIPIPKTEHRLQRVSSTVISAYKKALQLEADLYHFHDPELIPVGVLLNLHGKNVIYDVHEDVPLQILNKYWIPKYLRPILAQITKLVEKYGAKSFSRIVAATPQIASKFPPHKTVTVQNFPSLNEFPQQEKCHSSNQTAEIVYVGVINHIRGVREMICAVGLLPETLNIRLTLAGIMEPAELEAELQQIPGYSRVVLAGWRDRTWIGNLLTVAKVGLVTLHPIPNFIESYPIKLFEYMAAGIPVVASDFPLWHQIVTEAGCGLLVDPCNPQEIAEAIQWLLTHPNEAEAMGQRGRQAVEQRFNWKLEQNKLIQLYADVINHR